MASHPVKSIQLLVLSHCIIPQDSSIKWLRDLFLVIFSSKFLRHNRIPFTCFARYEADKADQARRPTVLRSKAYWHLLNFHKRLARAGTGPSCSKLPSGLRELTLGSWDDGRMNDLYGDWMVLNGDLMVFNGTKKRWFDGLWWIMNGINPLVSSNIRTWGRTRSGSIIRRSGRLWCRAGPGSIRFWRRFWRRFREVFVRPGSTRLQVGTGAIPGVCRCSF